MGLSWQQGPLGRDPIGTFLVEGGLREVSYVEPLRRLMSARLGGQMVAASENALILFEPSHYPVAYFPIDDVAAGALEETERVTNHELLGPTAWYTVNGGEETRQRAAWRHVDPPGFAALLGDHIAFSWRAMDAYYEEAERIIGHAADPYHRIDIRRSERRLTVERGGIQIAATTSARVLYESGFAPRWYVPEADVQMDLLASVDFQTFCPYKGVASYYDIGEVTKGAWSYRSPIEEMERIAGMVSFEPGLVTVRIDGNVMEPETGQGVVSHGVDRNLTVDEAGKVSSA